MRLPVQTHASLARPCAAGAAPRTIAPSSILDDILGGISTVANTVAPIVRTVAPIACGMCAMIPDPMAKMACMAACSAVH